MAGGLLGVSENSDVILKHVYSGFQFVKLEAAQSVQRGPFLTFITHKLLSDASIF